MFCRFSFDNLMVSSEERVRANGTVLKRSVDIGLLMKTTQQQTLVQRANPVTQRGQQRQRETAGKYSKGLFRPNQS